MRQARAAVGLGLEFVGQGASVNARAVVARQPPVGPGIELRLTGAARVRRTRTQHSETSVVLSGPTRQRRLARRGHLVAIHDGLAQSGFGVVGSFPQAWQMEPLV